MSPSINSPSETDQFPITSTITLPYCWVCKRRFMSSGGGDPTVVVHVHHVVPRAAGGSHGPTVTLCTHDHDLLHRIAESWIPLMRRNRNLYSSRGTEMLSMAPEHHRPRLTYLAKVAARSLLSVEGDPNKHASVGVPLNPNDARLLAELQKVWPLSKSDLLLKLLREAHKHTFPVNT